LGYIIKWLDREFRGFQETANRFAAIWHNRS
jgi:hypothetical protein